VLQGVGDAALHGGGDVAVDAADAAEAVAEAAGLGDFGDVVFDEPGFVVWRRSWKCMPGRIGGVPRWGSPVTAGVQARVRTVRRECLDRILIYNIRHLLAVLGEYLTHYNGNRPHQGRGQRPPDRQTLPPPVMDLDARRVRRHKVLGGLVNEYSQAA
jgi:hypothetical protein